ncbi:hypothetical protein OG892_01765 [Streptomyces sp. NBC_00341]|uniref:hypothetical protein n=1 Tax=unclassified Streptomyces TaxID=2593676 RepID=UPI003090C9F2|nr:hypothetical protein OG892_01765 [Streptomyces sp. NBC_00341]
MLRRLMGPAAAGSLAVLALTGVAAAAAPPPVTLEQCVEGGGGANYAYEHNKLVAFCSGGTYDTRPVSTPPPSIGPGFDLSGFRP